MHIRRSLRKKLLSRIFLLAWTCAVLFAAHGDASAASLRIQASSAMVTAGNIMTFTVLANSEGIAVNNVEAKIVFPKDMLEIVSISKSGSEFSLWVEEPSFSNSSGIITFNGGVPTPGFSGSSGTVVSFVARAKKSGQAELIFSDAAIRANDGFGTDILSSKQGKLITIISSEDPEKTEPAPKPAEIAPAAPVPANQGAGLQLSSPTHPNQDQWYKDNSPTYRWNISGSSAIQTGLDSSASGVPRVTYSPAISEKKVADLEDGVWYFKVRSQKSGSWGPVSTYIVRIDTTAPQLQEEAVFSYDNASKILSIQAEVQDITSGIDKYEIYINDTLAKTVSAKEFDSGKYGFEVRSSGYTRVKLLAIDRAGNSLSSEGSFVGTGEATLDVDPVPKMISASDILYIGGKAESPNSSIVVHIESENGKSIVVRTSLDSNNGFAVRVPNLPKGKYKIGIDLVSGEQVLASTQAYTEVVDGQLITWMNHAYPASRALIGLVLALVLLGALGYLLGFRNSRSVHRIRLRTLLTEGDNSKAFNLLKQRLERHLEVLQETRHERVLTRVEKEIKSAIEGDLDEVDGIIASQKISD